jgi:hypothetical protein
MTLEFASDIAASEWRLAGDHLEQTASQRVDVRLGIGDLASLLQFWSGVVGASGQRSIRVDRLYRPRAGKLGRIL